MPRAELGRVASPVQQDAGWEGAGELWLKRDDLNAPVAGGNKVRALEFLLAGAGSGTTVITVGGTGSTHVYATATHARRVGARAVAVRWPQVMHPLAHRVAATARERCARTVDLPLPLALPIAIRLRLAAASGRRVMGGRAHWVPFGGTSALGVLGHVNGALEFADDLAAGRVPRPDAIVLPIGSAGTTAGLRLGLALAGLEIPVIAARCGPRIGITHRRLETVTRAAMRLIEARSSVRIPWPDPGLVEIDHSVYGGAYGRPHPEGARLATSLYARTGVLLDATYTAKALLAAARHAERCGGGRVLLWVTFDAREFGDATG